MVEDPWPRDWQVPVAGLELVSESPSVGGTGELSRRAYMYVFISYAFLVSHGKKRFVNPLCNESMAGNYLGSIHNSCGDGGYRLRAFSNQSTLHACVSQAKPFPPRGAGRKFSTSTWTMFRRKVTNCHHGSNGNLARRTFGRRTEFKWLLHLPIPGLNPSPIHLVIKQSRTKGVIRT